MGFSTTGKSTILRSLEEENIVNVNFIDSDSIISSDYGNRIYNLFLSKHKNEDPENREEIMSEIDKRENNFLIDLMNKKDFYVAALGPNIHTRKKWKEYYSKTNPFVIFLKADVNDVYVGLKRREDELYKEFNTKTAFGNWNHGVIRQYDSIKGEYTLLPEDQAKKNISELITVNENYYSTIANEIFEANTLFKWHEKFNSNKRAEIFEIIKTKVIEGAY